MSQQPSFVGTLPVRGEVFVELVVVDGAVEGDHLHADVDLAAGTDDRFPDARNVPDSMVHSAVDAVGIPASAGVRRPFSGLYL
jgi:hypothetical protein